MQLLGDDAVSEEAGRHGNLEGQPVLGQANVKNVSSLQSAIIGSGWRSGPGTLCMPCRLCRVSSVRVRLLVVQRPGERHLLAFVFLSALHLLLGDAKALAVADVQFHLAEYVCDDAGRLPRITLSSFAPPPEMPNITTYGSNVLY